MYHRQIEEVADIEKFYQWLEKAGLKDSTEALIMAAQEQAECESAETVQHIITGCKMQARTAYM